MSHDRAELFDSFVSAAVEAPDSARTAALTDEIMAMAFRAIRSGSDGGLREIAREAARCAQRLRGSDLPLRDWFAGQLQAVAALTRVALSVALPANVSAALRERKNLLPLLRAIGTSERSASALASYLQSDLSQTMREIKDLAALKLVETTKHHRRRWVRLTPLGVEAVKSEAVRDGAPAEKSLPAGMDLVRMMLDVQESISGLQDHLHGLDARVQSLQDARGTTAAAEHESAVPASFPSDADAVSRVLAGDDASFQLLIDRYRRTLRNVALQITGNAADADDVVQETFIRAYRTLGQLDDRSSVGAWLRQVAVSCSVDLLRARGNREDAGTHEPVEFRNDDPRNVAGWLISTAAAVSLPPRRR